MLMELWSRQNIEDINSIVPGDQCAEGVFTGKDTAP